MKKSILGLLSVFVLIGGCSLCHAPKPQKVENMGGGSENLIVGGQKDEHGCPVTAGYTWSQTRKSCIRVWEAGAKFDDLRDPNSPLAIFVIGNGENGPVEIYLPETGKSVVLDKKNDNWQSSDGIFVVKNSEENRLIILKSGREIAKQSAKP